MEARHLWLQDYVKRKVIEILKEDGTENPADLGTKPMTGNKMLYLLDKLSYGLPWGVTTPVRKTMALMLMSLLLLGAAHAALRPAIGFL